LITYRTRPNAACVQTELYFGAWQLLGVEFYTKHLLVNKYNINTNNNNKAGTVYFIQFNLG